MIYIKSTTVRTAVSSLLLVAFPSPCFLGRAKQDTLLLDRCILHEKTLEMEGQHKEDVGRLRVEFQLERSDLRKKCREVSEMCLMFSSPPQAAPVLLYILHETLHTDA